jgi:hypothetical protein
MNVLDGTVTRCTMFLTTNVGDRDSPEQTMVDGLVLRSIGGEVLRLSANTCSNLSAAPDGLDQRPSDTSTGPENDSHAGLGKRSKVKPGDCCLLGFQVPVTGI